MTDRLPDINRRDFLRLSGAALALGLGALTGSEAETAPLREEAEQRIEKMGLGPFVPFYGEAVRFSRMVPGFKEMMFPDLVSTLMEVGRGEIFDPKDVRVVPFLEESWGKRIDEIPSDAKKHIDKMEIYSAGDFTSSQSLPEIQDWLRNRMSYLPRLVLMTPRRVGTYKGGGGRFLSGGFPAKLSESAMILSNLDNQSNAVVSWTHETGHFHDKFYREVSQYYDRTEMAEYMIGRYRIFNDVVENFANCENGEVSTFKEGNPLFNDVPSTYKSDPNMVDLVGEQARFRFGIDLKMEENLTEKYNVLAHGVLAYWIKNRDHVPFEILRNGDQFGQQVGDLLWSVMEEFRHYMIGPVQDKGLGLLTSPADAPAPNSFLTKKNLELEILRRRILWGIGADSEQWEMVRSKLDLTNEAADKCTFGSPDGLCVSLGEQEMQQVKGVLFAGGVFVAVMLPSILSWIISRRRDSGREL